MGVKQFIKRNGGIKKISLEILCTVLIGASIGIPSGVMYKNSLKKNNQIQLERIIQSKEKYFVNPSSIQNTKPYVEMENFENWLKDKNVAHEQMALFLGKKVVDSYIKFIDDLGYEAGLRLVDTPVKARILALAYLERNGYQANKTFYSLKEVHDNKIKIDCSEATTIIAASLFDNGFQPLMLVVSPSYEDIKNNNRESHAAFLYKYNNKFGFIDNNFMSGPVFLNVENLIDFMGKKYDINYQKYYICDLSKENPDWMQKIDIEKIPYLKDINKTIIKAEKNNK
jgi:hypothetical protein